jgi:predicted NAD/FAD-binding protein
MTSGERGVSRRIAVIGTGISGLAAAWLLSRSHAVTVYEKATRIGGHSNTVLVEPMGFGPCFQRLWVYYLTYCEVGFRFKAVNVRLFKLVKQAGSGLAAAGLDQA